jgi:nucleotide-binding universal stress UspA family protein
MRIIIGADIVKGVNAPTVNLLKRLRFNAAQVEAVRVISPLVFPMSGSVADTGIASSSMYLGTMYELEEKQVGEATRQVAAEFGNSSAGSLVLHGHPVDMLLKHAQETATNLIAVGGHEDNPLVAALVGSTARSMILEADQSVLIAKASDASPDRPVRAVLATDHSSYANACWEHFMRFMPRGIEHLTILTSYPQERLKAWEPVLPPMGISPTTAVYNDLCARNEELKTRLARHLERQFDTDTVTIDSVVSPLPIHQAIEAQMSKSHADLLILGAKGHSFIERLSIGSVALQEALTLKQSVWIIRK